MDFDFLKQAKDSIKSVQEAIEVSDAAESWLAAEAAQK